MRPEIKEMDRNRIDEYLKSQKVGILSLTDGEAPYGIPLAYSYDGDYIYLTLGPQGRKMDYIQKNGKACFTVYDVPPEFGMADMSWTSVICDGEIHQVTDPETLTKAVRSGERQMGLPEGTWDGLLEKTLQNPAHSSFWKVSITTIHGRQC